jgi:hypothetical protein
MPNFELWHSCGKWSMCSTKTQKKHCCVSVGRHSIFIKLLTADICSPTVHTERSVAFQQQRWLHKTPHGYVTHTAFIITNTKRKKYNIIQDIFLALLHLQPESITINTLLKAQ